jgi:hypothetical protein
MDLSAAITKFFLTAAGTAALTAGIGACGSHVAAAKPVAAVKPVAAPAPLDTADPIQAVTLTPEQVAAQKSTEAQIAGADASASSRQAARQAVPKSDAIAAGLVGLLAQDNALTTKAVCQPATLKVWSSGSETATCIVTESDNVIYSGFGNAAAPVDGIIVYTFEPQTIISGG